MRGSDARRASGIRANAGYGRRICALDSLLAVAPLAALIVTPFLILLAMGANPTAAAAQDDPAKSVALLHVQFLNDHADLEPTTAAERARLASVDSLFKAKLEASGRCVGLDRKIVVWSTSTPRSSSMSSRSR
jgi:hypothetical protein